MCSQHMNNMIQCLKMLSVSKHCIFEKKEKSAYRLTNSCIKMYESLVNKNICTTQCVLYVFPETNYLAVVAAPISTPFSILLIFWKLSKLLAFRHNYDIWIATCHGQRHILRPIYQGSC